MYIMLNYKIDAKSDQVLLNCYFWIDPAKKVTGAMFTQLLPFFDARVVSLYGTFERELYRGLERT